jgi:ketoreductase RED2
VTASTEPPLRPPRPQAQDLDGRVALAGVRPTGSSIPYAVSKAAVNHLTVFLANVLGPEIRVHAIAPGLIDAPWTADWHEVRQRVCETAPLKRAGTPEDVADTCIALIQARYSTGQIVLVDGGMGLR